MLKLKNKNKNLSNIIFYLSTGGSRNVSFTYETNGKHTGKQSVVVTQNTINWMHYSSYETNAMFITKFSILHQSVTNLL